MKHPIRLLAPILTVGGLLACVATAYAQQTARPGSSESALAHEAPFLAENNSAMDKVMAGMSVKPTGDVDTDFAAMMIATERRRKPALDLVKAADAVQGRERAN